MPIAVNRETKPQLRPDPIHRGDARSSPYPTSRLAPAFSLVELATELEKADLVLSSKTNAQLELIADQIRALQSKALEIMEKAREDLDLHSAECSFRKIPGREYHLYRNARGGLQFSMLSPGDWGGQPPQPFMGSYRLEVDMSWTRLTPETDYAA